MKYYTVLLIFIFFFAIFIKVNMFENSRKGAFIPWTNVNAFHYYFAKEIAEGRRLKSREIRMQYPEGIEVFRKTSIFMEYVTGYFYRGLNRFLNISFDDFTRHFVRIWTSLTIFAVYLVTYEIYKSRLAGLVSSLFYSVSLPAITRSVGFGFLRENFTLPVIFLQFLFFMLAIKGTRWLLMALVSGVLMFIALASWHFSQFYLVLIEGFVLMRLVFSNDRQNVRLGGRDACPTDRLIKAFSILLAFGLASGIFVPYLAANSFLISYPMLIGYAIVGGWILNRCTSRTGVPSVIRSERSKINLVFRNFNNFVVADLGRLNLRYAGSFLITFLVLILLTSSYQKDAEVYSHVYSMGIYQLRYLGMNPIDPSRVPFDAKLLWEASHGAPALRDALYDWTVPFLVALVPIFFMIKKIIREGWDEKAGLLIYFLIMSFILYLFINRLMVFLAFFLSIFAGGLICRTGFVGRTGVPSARADVPPTGRTGVPPVKEQWIRVVSISFILLALMAETAKASIGTIDVREGIYTLDVLGWISKNTKMEDVILAPPRSSPEILAYTGRTVVLHAKLESKDIRDKTRRWAESLFVRDEENLYGLCREWGVRYFVYPIGTYSNKGPSSWSYITNNVHKDTDAVGYKLELIGDAQTGFGFEFGGNRWTGEIKGTTNPPDLKHFLLAYRNRFFNIYEVK